MNAGQPSRRPGFGWLAAVVVLGALALTPFAPATAGRPRVGGDVARGRRVYLEEGCLHCHSQFVRDVDPQGWGARSSTDEVHRQGIPTPGNRRLGPDLARVGDRRSDAWQRAHLLAPRSVSPGSTMPSYARLFRGGDPRGDDLVAYLASLRSPEAPPREPWTPSALALVARPDPALGAARFALLCTACHGPRGAGLEAPPLPAPALAGASPSFLAGLDAGARRLALARLVRDGRPGTGMPGHETLGDRELLAVADHVIARVLAPAEAVVVRPSGPVTSPP